MLVKKALRVISPNVPIFVTEWKFRVFVEFINYRVPDSVEIVRRVVVLQLEAVASSVTLRVLIVDSSGVMQWLVHVTYDVNEQSHTNRKRIKI